MAFFEKAAELELKHSKIAAFGSTRRASSPVEEDPQIKLLLDAATPVVTIFGKSWLLHVTDVLRTTPEENLSMIEDSVRFLKEQGKEVVYDAEHFYDGFSSDPDYALSTLEAARKGGADFLVLCETNGGKLVTPFKEITTAVVERFPDTPIGVHCHNDAGVGVAVSLAGVEAGATMVQGTMNGYGERNGNANLTTIIPNLEIKMDLKTNSGQYLSKLRDLSLFIDDATNLRPDIRSPTPGLHPSPTREECMRMRHQNPTELRAYRPVDRRKPHPRPCLRHVGRSSVMMKPRKWA